MAWSYRIKSRAEAPRGAGSKETGGPLVTFDAAEPRVALYCEEWSHDGGPWLFGSFVPNYEWYEQTGETRWAWEYTYPTGDGVTFHLPAAKTKRSLIGDSVVDATSDANLLYDEQLRGRYSFKCGICGFSRSWRDESTQLACSGLWAARLLEVKLSTFDRAVKRFASA